MPMTTPYEAISPAVYSFEQALDGSGLVIAGNDYREGLGDRARSGEIVRVHDAKL